MDKEPKCKALLDMDPETFDDYFFPNKYDRAIVQMAKRICDMCEVKTECLTIALEEGHYTGVYGGLTPQERHGIKQ